MSLGLAPRRQFLILAAILNYALKGSAPNSEQYANDQANA